MYFYLLITKFISAIFVVNIFTGYSFQNVFAQEDNITNINDDIPKNANELLKQKLLMNMDKYSVPLVNGKAPDIKISFKVHHFDIEEFRGTMAAHGYLHMTWSNDKFVWNSSDYDEIKIYRIHQSEVWRPEFVVMNSANAQTENQFGETVIVIYNDGKCEWSPPFQFHIFCKLDLRFWPYDSQKCQIQLGSWQLKDLEMKLINEGDKINEMQVSNSWKITDIQSTIESDAINHYVELTVSAKRRSSLYKPIILVPANCIIILTLACFWLPPQAGEKILLNGFILFMISSFLMYFAQILPVLAKSIPLVVLFYSISLVLVSISMGISVLVLFLANPKEQNEKPMPAFWKKLLHGPLNSIFLLSHLNPKLFNPPETSKNNNELNASAFDDQNIMVEPAGDFQNKSNNYDWIILATAIDRFFFLTFCLVFIILACVYSI